MISSPRGIKPHFDVRSFLLFQPWARAARRGLRVPQQRSLTIQDDLESPLQVLRLLCNEHVS